MKPQPLGGGLLIEECEVGVVIADEIMDAEGQHLVLTRQQAAIVYVWLGQYLSEEGGEHVE